MKNFLVKCDGFFNKLFKTETVASPLSSILSAVFGLLFGFILLIIFNPSQCLQGFGSLLTAGFSNFPKLLYGTSILLLNGLAISIAYKCGLFNIGCSGQFTVGAMFALIFAHALDCPWYVCLLMGMVGGALMGGIVGLLKAFFNVNEVISSIMLNFIGLFTTNLVFTNMFDLTATNSMGATIALSTYHKGSILPHLDTRGYLSLSIIIALIAAIIIYILLDKTTLGYELKGVGFNRNAAKYAGINYRKNIITVMLISGALAGLAGGCQYLSGVFQYKVVDTVLADGFNGISVAFLANCNPIGCIFSALFIYYITMAQSTLQIYGYSTELVTIIVGSIIYLSAFALIIKNILVSRNYRSRLKSAILDRHYRIILNFKGKYKKNQTIYLEQNKDSVDKKELKKAKELDKYYENSKLMFINSSYVANRETINDTYSNSMDLNYKAKHASQLYVTSLAKTLKKTGSLTIKKENLYIKDSRIKLVENLSYTDASKENIDAVNTLENGLLKDIKEHYKTTIQELKTTHKNDLAKLKEEHKVKLNSTLVLLEKGEEA